MIERVAVSKKLLVINSASAFGSRLLSIAVLIWLQQYLLKRIPTEEYSLLPVVFAVMIFVPFLVGILASGIKRYVLDAYAKNDDERITEIVSTMLPLLGVASLCIIAIGSLIVWNAEVLFRIEPEYVDDARIMLGLLVVSAAVRMFLEGYGSGLFVRQRFVLLNLIELGGECLRAFLLLTLLLGLGTSVVWVVVATVSADLFKVSTITIVSMRLVPSQRFERARLNLATARELVRFGGWSALYGFCGAIRKSMDAIILNRLATPLDVTCFHLGSLVPKRIEIMINNSFTGIVSPVVMGMHAKRQADKLKNAYLRIGRIALWGILFPVAPLLAYHEQIVRLYVGDKYLAAGNVMLLLLAWYPIMCGNIIHTELAKAKIRVRSLALRDAVATAANLALTLVAVGYYQMGATGAAAATLLTYGLGSIALLWPFGMEMAGATWTQVVRRILAPGLTPFVVAMLVMLLISAPLRVESWTALGANCVVGGLAYVMTVWFVMGSADRAQLRELLRSFGQPVRRSSGPEPD